MYNVTILLKICLHQRHEIERDLWRLFSPASNSNSKQSKWCWLQNFFLCQDETGVDTFFPHMGKIEDSFFPCVLTFSNMLSCTLSIDLQLNVTCKHSGANMYQSARDMMDIFSLFYFSLKLLFSLLTRLHSIK